MSNYENHDLEQEKRLAFTQTSKIRQAVIYLIVLVIVIAIVSVIFYQNFREKKRLSIELMNSNETIVAQNGKLQERNDRIETLFKEVHHRVKNNLQLVSSLLDMQQEWSGEGDATKVLADSRSRVIAMSMIHQFLYKTDDLRNINFNSYVHELIESLDKIYPDNDLDSYSIDFEDDYIFDIDTSVSLGLILNELITNSYKHTSLDNSTLKIELRLKEGSNRMLSLTYWDNGNEMETSFTEAIKKGFGLRLASRLAKQLQGNLTYQFNDGNTFKLAFANEELRAELVDSEHQ